MLKNIYGPLSAGRAQEKVLEILANNIANSGTTGFKEQDVSFSAMLANPWPNYQNPNPPAPFKKDMNDVFPLRGNEMSYMATSEVSTSFTQGPIARTENSLDIAIEGNGFFSIETAFGERFTRDGSFSLTPEGTLITKNGWAVMGENGPITGLSEGDLRIAENGDVFQGDVFVDRLRLTAFEEPSLLERIGDNAFVHDGSPDNLTRFQGRISQGFLEGSNVNPMRNMANMITAHRTYEAIQKAIQAHDQTMEKGSNEVGAVRG